MDDAHAAAAPTAHRLDEHRIANAVRDLERFVVRLDGAGAALDDRDPCSDRGGTGLGLVADAADRLHVGADELDVVRAADLGEVCVLGEEAVAGVDGVDVGDLRGGDDVRDREIGLRARSRTDADGIVRERQVVRSGVGFRVDDDALDVELTAGPDHAKGDFAPVGDENALEHRALMP